MLIIKLKKRLRAYLCINIRQIIIPMAKSLSYLYYSGVSMASYLLRAFTLNLILIAGLQASLNRVEIEHYSKVLDGKPFGLVGPYEQFIGTLYFSVDPSNEINDAVTDIELAPLNNLNQVEFSANFTLIKPIDAKKGNRTLLFGTSNRGSRRLLTFFNHGNAPGQRWDAPIPETAENYGDGFLMNQGFSLLWVGWQFDTPVTRIGGSRSFVPQATNIDQPITGLVRSDFTIGPNYENPDSPADVFDRTLADRNHVPYPVSDPDSELNVLTVRDTREGERRVIPRSQWDFARIENGLVIADHNRIYLSTGFEPYKIYEVVYVAQDPQIIGLGLAAIRDAVSSLKYDGFEDLNVGSDDLQHAIGFGLSQPGRTLRTFLYDGFNQDEEGRKVFDGIMSHIAGAARGSFNIRFGQASRDAHPYLNFYYPTDIFPFSDVAQTDPLTGETDGLLMNVPEHLMPKLYNSFSSYEYWGRAVSLLHTDPDGERDVDTIDSARVYHFAGAQHLPVSFPPQQSNGQLPNNPNDFSWMMRSLLVAMQNWVAHDIPAPESVVPKIADGTLVPHTEVNFIDIPGVNLPIIPHLAYRVDYGPRFKTEGIIDIEPPIVGEPFGVRVPQVNEDGNELAGLQMPELKVPLATYNGWNLYNNRFGPTNVISHMSGSFIPFPLTEDDRAQNGDPRPSIEARYQSKAEYMGLVLQETLDLVSNGYLLDHDMDEILNAASSHWDYLINQ